MNPALRFGDRDTLDPMAAGFKFKERVGLPAFNFNNIFIKGNNFKFLGESKAVYMFCRSEAKILASSPPVPGRISKMMLPSLTPRGVTFPPRGGMLIKTFFCSVSLIISSSARGFNCGSASEA